MGEQRAGVGLAAGLAIVTLALFVAYSAVLTVLLPAQVARLDPEGKVGTLALVTAVSFGATAIAQPLIGALSDRTRSPWGRRRPWMLGGALVGGAAVAAVGGVESVLVLVVIWAVGQFALNGADIASTTYLVDAYRPERRARIAAVFGVSAIAGGGIGALVAGTLGHSPALASSLVAVMVVVAFTGFVVLVRDDEQPSTAERFSLRRLLAGFALHPRRDPAFALVLASRFCFGLAYQGVAGFLYYLLTDYLRVPESDAAGLAGSITALGAAGVIIAIVVVGWASERSGRRVPFLIGASLLAAAALVLVLLVPATWVVVLVGVVLGLALGTAIVAGTTMASLTLPGDGHDTGRGLGVYNFVSNIAQALGPIVATIAITVLGGYPALLAVAIAAMLASAALLVPLRRVH